MDPFQTKFHIVWTYYFLKDFQISRNLVQSPKTYENSTSGPRALKSVGPWALKSAGGPWEPFRPKSSNSQNPNLHFQQLSWFFRHNWEDGSRKVNMNAVNFSPTPWHCCSFMSQAVRKPCFSASVPRGAILPILIYWAVIIYSSCSVPADSDNHLQL